MNIKSHIVQLVKYGFFGVIATIVHLFTAWAIITFLRPLFLLPIPLHFLRLLSFLMFFSTLYVFHSTFHIKKLLKFFSVQYGTFLFSYLLSEVFPIQNSYIHTLVIVALMPLINFGIHKFWTFK